MKRLNLILLSLSAAALLLTTGCFRASSETRALRNAVLDNSPGTKWEEQIEFGLGALTFGVAKLGVGVAGKFADLPEEARLVLQSAQAGDVSVHQLVKGSPASDISAILQKADLALEKKGWSRIVGVQDKDNLVAIYVPDNMTSVRKARVCVLVMDGRDLVCAQAKADLRPLFTLAMDKAFEEGGLRVAARGGSN